MGQLTTLPPTHTVQIHLDGYCHTCKLWHRHPPLSPTAFSEALWDWHAKHMGHEVELLSPRRRLPRRFRDWLWQRLGVAPWWLDYRENTNFKLSFTAATVITCTLASLASSGTFVAGREAAGVDNSSARNIDSEITAKLTTGTSPTVDTELRVYGYQALNPDTPLYPDTISGTNAAVTLTSTYQLSGGFLLLGSSAVSATSSIGYPIKCLSTAQAWGKEPKRWGLYITHNTAVALHATGTNHVLTYTSAFLTDT